jgi:hypothetical protein
MARKKRIDTREKKSIIPILCAPFPMVHPSTKLPSERAAKMTTSTPLLIGLASDSRVVIINDHRRMIAYFPIKVNYLRGSSAMPGELSKPSP